MAFYSLFYTDRIHTSGKITKMYLARLQSVSETSFPLNLEMTSICNKLVAVLLFDNKYMTMEVQYQSVGNESVILPLRI